MLQSLSISYYSELLLHLEIWPRSHATTSPCCVCFADRTSSKASYASLT